MSRSDTAMLKCAASFVAIAAVYPSARDHGFSFYALCMWFLISGLMVLGIWSPLK